MRPALRASFIGQKRKQAMSEYRPHPDFESLQSVFSSLAQWAKRCRDTLETSKRLADCGPDEAARIAHDLKLQPKELAMNGSESSSPDLTTPTGLADRRLARLSSQALSDANPRHAAYPQWRRHWQCPEALRVGPAFLLLPTLYRRQIPPLRWRSSTTEQWRTACSTTTRH